MVSESVADSIIASLSFALLTLLVRFVYETDGADDVGGVDVIWTRVIDLFANLSLLDHWGVTSELLDELKSIDHHSKSFSSLLSNGHHSDKTRLETILQHESSTVSTLEIKRDWSQTAHMEESLVLNPWDALMFQVLDIHEGTLLCEILPLIGLQSAVIVRRARSGWMTLTDSRAEGGLLVLHWTFFVLTVAWG